MSYNRPNRRQSHGQQAQHYVPTNGTPDAHQQAIDNLPHNKALAGHPMFG